MQSILGMKCEGVDTFGMFNKLSFIYKAMEQYL